MSRNLFLIAALAILAAISSGRADEVKDAATFVQETIPIIDALKDECQYIADNIVENISEDIENKVKVAGQLDDCGAKLREIAKTAATYDLEKIDDVPTRLTIERFRNLDESCKLGEDIIQLGLKIKSLEETYEDESIESFHDSDVNYSVKEIDNLYFITRTEDINEINYYWKVVADKIGEQVYGAFFDFIEMVQRAAKEYDLSAVKFWYPNYSEKTMNELESLMTEMKPLYEQLHAYIRHKLINRYGIGVVKPHGPIPETLYHQIEDRIWKDDNHYEDDLPYSLLPNYEQLFEDNNINSKTLVEKAEKFYISMGFDPLGELYWEKLIHEDSNNPYNSCESVLYDERSKNITLIYCENSYFEDYLQYYVNMGRLYSVLVKENLPWYFNDENFIGKAVGHAIRLAAQSPKHLQAQKLAPVEGISDDAMENINIRLAFSTLFKMTRQYVGIRLVTDLLAGKIKKADVNNHYWKLWEQYGGVEPPMDRTEDSMDIPYQLILDVMANKNIILDFQQHVLSYEIFKAACSRSGHTGPLYNCDFSTNKDVAVSLKQVMSSDAIKEFAEVIAPIIPKYQGLSAESIVSYFEPGYKWLTKYNAKNNLTVGWDASTRSLSDEILTSEEDALDLVEKSSQRIYELYNQIVDDLFTEKLKDDAYEDEFFGNVFWRTSKSAIAAEELKQISLQAQKFDYTKFKSKPLKKALEKLSQIADVFVLGEDLEGYMYNKNYLFNISTDDDIAKYKDKSDEPETVPYNPYILNVFKTSKDPEELKYYWEAWRDKNGDFAKTLLSDIIKSFEKAAEILGISKTEFWFKHYSDDYVRKMEKVIDMVRPMYMKLHYYVRERLALKYSSDEFSTPNGAIPDHLVQQVLAQIWTNESIVEDDFPYNKLPPIEQALKEKNYDATQILIIAEDFYQSLGFDPLEESFWNDRVKPQEGSATDANCHGRIYDKTPKVYMRYCDRVSYRKLLQNHGYMGRVHYAVEKKDLPAYFFDSYDYEYPVGEAVILSASSPKHAQKMSYITDFEVTDQTLLNRLIRMGIHTFFNLHRYFVHTKIIAEYLEGDIEENDLNRYYWTYMIKHAGIEPPNDRRSVQYDFPFDFYAAVEENHQLKKFTSEVLGYRIYEKLCKISGHKGDLNNCDFYGSEEAGKALRKMMQLGSSRPRQTVLKTLLEDVSGLNGNSMITYYDPLVDWLKKTLTGSESDFDSWRRWEKVEIGYYV